MTAQEVKSKVIALVCELLLAFKEPTEKANSDFSEKMVDIFLLHVQDKENINKTMEEVFWPEFFCAALEQSFPEKVV